MSFANQLPIVQDYPGSVAIFCSAVEKGIFVRNTIVCKYSITEILENYPARVDKVRK